MKLLALIAIWLLALTGACDETYAHEGSTTFLTLTALDDSRVRVEWDLELRELQQQIGLDADDSATVTWSEIVERREHIEAFVLERIRLATGTVSDPSECAVVEREMPALAERSAGVYLRLHLTFTCAGNANSLVLDHSRWFEVDPTYRVLLDYRAHSGDAAQAILSAVNPSWQNVESRLVHPRRFFVEGLRHLITGYDHLAFLGVLLIALARRSPHAAPLPLRVMLRRALLVITAFTFAHSVTLGLAASGYVELPSRPVETTIAASVLLAALLNFRHDASSHGWKLAFAFGLVHGLGFAGALAELASGRIDVLALLAFNVGIEAAQVAIAAVAVPASWFLFRRDAIARVGVPLLSLVAGSFAVVWLGTRLTA
jgi:hypothetical protein